MLGALAAEFLPYIIGAGALIAALFGYGATQRKKGRKRAEMDAKEADNEYASEIRHRVEHVGPDGLRKHDDAGWRD